MDVFIQNVLYHPLAFIGAGISFLAVITFLMFLRGFMSGVMYLFTLNGNDDFLKAARIRVLWAFLLLVFFFAIWQVIQWVGALVTNSEWPAGTGLGVTLLIFLFVLQWTVHYYTKIEKGH